MLKSTIILDYFIIVFIALTFWYFITLFHSMNKLNDSNENSTVDRNRIMISTYGYLLFIAALIIGIPNIFILFTIFG